MLRLDNDMRTVLAVFLMIFACLSAGAQTPAGRPPCTCTVSFPGTRSAEIARQLKRASCHCAVAQTLDAPDSPIKVDVRDLRADHSGTLVAVAIIALALVTGSQAVFTARLWRSTRRLAATGEATAHRQLRAYVGVGHIAYEPSIESQATRVTITIRNFGATPAYKLAIAVDAQIATNEQQLSVATSTSRTLGHLPPGVEFAITRTAVIAPGAGATDQINGVHSAFVHGCIEYVDTFGTPHFTRFRLQDGADGRFFACREGNDTDDVMLSQTRAVPSQAMA
jgi:hypothetical protein